MGADYEILHFLKENAKEGAKKVTKLTDMIKDKKTKEALKLQKKEYEKIYDASIALLMEKDEVRKKLSLVYEIASFIHTKLEPSSSALFSLAKEKSNKNIVEIGKKMNEYKEASSTSLHLATKLLQVEEKNIDILKKFI